MAETSKKVKKPAQQASEVRHYVEKVQGSSLPLETLYSGVAEGKRILDDVYDRQFKLTGYVLDACLELALLEQLKTGKRFTSLVNQGLIQPSAQASPAMTQKISSEIEQFSRLGEGVRQASPIPGQILADLRKQGWMATSRTLIPKEENETYMKLAREFTSQWDNYEAAVNGWRKLGDRHTLMPRPPYEDDPRLAQQPADPRIARFEELHGDIATLLDSGYKAPDSAVRKLSDKNKGNVFRSSAEGTATGLRSGM